MTIQEIRNNIIAKIYENSNGDITGENLQQVLLQMLSAIPSSTGGQDGQDGVGIVDIVVTDYYPEVAYSAPRPGEGLILGAAPGSGKKITIYLSDGREKTFYLENGVDGRDGRDGQDGSDGSFDESEFEDFKDEFYNYKDEVTERIARVKSQLETSTSESIGEAMNQLSLTQDELSYLQGAMSVAAQNAQDALEAARRLSGMTINGITTEELEEILGMNREVQDWMLQFSGHVVSLMAEYDEVLQNLGEIGIGVDASKGLLSILAESISTVSGTVGTVKSEWDASKGTLANLSTWYNESAGTYANLVRKMDGANAYIEDLIQFYEMSGGTSFLSQYMDGKIAEFGRTIGYSGQDLTSIEERLNGISATVSTAITRYDGMSGELITINSRMDGLAGEISTSLTKAESALTQARDLREIWSVESGILRTVSDLIIRTDEAGDPIYWYIDPELEDPSDRTQWVRVYYMGEDPDTGLPYYNTNKNGSGTRHDTNVFPDYMAGVFSYIKQAPDQIEFSVESGDVLTALRLQVTSGGSVIYMTADRVVIDADIIANSLTTKSANIGGVHIGAGMISAQTGNNKWALRGDGVLEATGANIKGAVTATSGSFKGSVSADSGYFKGDVYADNGYFKGSVSADSGYFRGKIYADDGTFKGSVSATSGYFQNLSASNITIEESRFTGDITANSLTLGSQTIQEYISSKVSAATGSEGITEADVNRLIGDFLDSYGFVSGSQISGYVTQADLEEWVEQWNATHSGETLTSADVQTIATRVLGSEISNVLGVSENPDGSLHHTVKIGDKTYTWDTMDLGDYVLLGDWYGDSANTGTGFLVDTNGLLKANNAIIFGKIYASEGYFKGDVTASTLTLGEGGPTIQNYISSRLSAATGSEGLTETDVNRMIGEYLSSQDFVSGSQLSGYVTQSSLEEWANNWNATHSGETLTSADVQTIASRIVGSEISNVLAVTENPDGSLHHKVIIGGNTYEWDTYDFGDYIAIGDWYGESATTGTGFMVDTNGLLQANNAIIYGAVYASEGKFKGSVSADSGYFKGELTASKLILEEPAQNAVKAVVSANSVTSAVVKNYVTSYVGSQGFATTAALSGYVDDESFNTWIAEWNASHSATPLTEEQVSAIARTVVGSELSQVMSSTTNSDGSVTHRIKIGNKTYTWDTFNAGDYMILGDWTGSSAHTGTGFMVDTNGLLQANNAIIYGAVYASEGKFKGSVSADSGYFKGNIYADNGYFKGSVSADSGYFSGEITASKLTLGTQPQNAIKSIVSANSVTSAVVKNYVSSYVNSQDFLTGDALNGYATSAGVKNWVNSLDYITEDEANALIAAVSGAEVVTVQSSTTTNGVTRHTIQIGNKTYSWDTIDADEYLILGDGVGTGTMGGNGYKTIINKNGLLQANNAVIYGAIYASEGKFKGSVSADSGYFTGIIHASGGEFKGSISADSGYFKGSVSATNGYFSGKIEATEGTFAGFVQMPYVDLEDLTKSGGKYYADNRAYLYYQSSPMGSGDSLVLPSPSSSLNGFMYDIIVAPRISRMDGADRLTITDASNSYIACFAYNEQFSSDEFVLTGGHYRIVCTFKYGTTGSFAWAITEATGSIEFGNVEVCTPLGYTTDGSYAINKIVSYTGSTPSVNNSSQTLFISRD